MHETGEEVGGGGGSRGRRNGRGGGEREAGGREEEEEWTWGNIPAGPPIMDRDQVCERLSPDTPGPAQK